MNANHCLEPGKPIRLNETTTNGKEFCSNRDAAENEFRDLRKELIELQTRLYSERRRKMLVVFQAMDAGGKDGTIRKVFSGVNPQGVRVTPFKQPSDEDLAHDYLWRVHRAVPQTGMIGVFNRSHYEDVLIARVAKLVAEQVWQQRYDQINQFEKLLVETGTTILKFYLHISKQEQKERFQARLDEPDKHWKFSPADLDKRKRWDDYMLVYEEALNRCTTPWAPWHVIPADQKWYRNLAVTRTIVETLRELNPRFPTTALDVDSIRIE